MSANKIKHCILHIGTEKTGTTTLQEFLSLNRGRLLSKGFLVPSSLWRGGSDHTFLATYSLDIHNLEDDLRIWRQIRSAEDVIRHRDYTVEELSKEINSALDKNNIMTILFSNEHCHSRLVNMEELYVLRSLIEMFAEKITIIVYLRPQHELLTSLYDTALRAGHSDIDVLPSFDSSKVAWVQRGYFDYAGLLDRWSSVFGKSNVQARIFMRTELVGGSIIDDFLAFVGLRPDEFIIPSRRNVSMDASCQVFLNFFNRYQRRFPETFSDDMRRGLIYTLEQISNGRGLRPSRADAVRFFSLFKCGNEIVRQTFFKDRDQLFTPDFSEFPESSTREHMRILFPMAVLRVLFSFILYKARRALPGMVSTRRAGRRLNQK